MAGDILNHLMLILKPDICAFFVLDYSNHALLSTIVNLFVMIFCGAPFIYVSREGRK